MTETLGRSPSRPDVGPAHLALGLGVFLFVVAFPFAETALVARYGTRAVAAVLLVAALASAAVARRRSTTPMAGSILLLLPIAVALPTDDARFLLLVPAAVYLLLAWTCLRSTREPQSLIERAARLMQPRAPDFIGPYCHGLTRLWAGLFALHAVAIAALAFFAPKAWWEGWTTWGFWSLCALISLVEFFVRKIHFRYYLGGPLDRLLSRFFPAEATATGRRSMAYVRETRAAMEEDGAPGAG